MGVSFFVIFLKFSNVRIRADILAAQAKLYLKYGNLCTHPAGNKNTKTEYEAIEAAMEVFEQCVQK